MEKTYKRELSSVLLVVYIGLLVAGVWSPEAFTASEAIKLEVFAFAALAFGMDAYSKQIK
jgi:uncharacterized membrane protein YiaA